MRVVGFIAFVSGLLLTWGLASASDTSAGVSSLLLPASTTPILTSVTHAALPVLANASTPAAQPSTVQSLQTVSTPTSSTTTSPPVDGLARLLAIAGLGIALANFGFSLWKAYRDRQFSKEDDFWFRKVVSPAAIEPILESFVKLGKDLPLRSSDQSTQADYARFVTTEFATLFLQVGTLALLDPKLPDLINKMLGQCEDFLMEYCSLLTKPVEKADPTASEIRHSLRGYLNETLKIIKAQHMAK